MSKCGAKTEVYSRVVGFYRPVKQWNDGKQEEFNDRLVYELDETKRKAHVPSPNRYMRINKDAGE